MSKKAKEQARAVAAEHRGRHQAFEPGELRASKRPGQITGIAIFGSVVVAVIVMMSLGSAGSSSVQSKNFTDPSFRPICFALGMAIGAGAFFLWRKCWLIADTPTMEVAGLGPGTFEVHGTIKPSGPAVSSWFTNTPCAFYKSTIERKSGDDWVKVLTQTDGSKRFWLEDDTGLLLMDVGTSMAGGRTLARGELKKGMRFTEEAYVVDESLWASGTVTHEQHGLVMGGPVTTASGASKRGSLTMAPNEDDLLRSWRGWARFLTVFSALLLGSTTVWEESISNHPEHLGEPSLFVRDGALLVPFATVLFVLGFFWAISYFVGLHNRLVGLKNQASAAWSNIEVAALQRHDLIEGLAAAAQGAAAHEREVLQVVAAREAMLSGQGDPDLPNSQAVGDADRALTADATARTNIARAEEMPQLRASAAFQQLFHALVKAEDRIAASRRYYNDAVILLADRSTAVPGNLFAKSVVPDGTPPPLTFDPAMAEPTKSVGTLAA